MKNVPVRYPTPTLGAGNVTATYNSSWEKILGLTLLIDLDNTLLGNDMDVFLPAYLQRLGRCLAVYAEPGKMIQALMHATQQMIENNHPTQTLKDVFDAHFYPTLHLPYEVPQADLLDFYEHEFGQLRPLTQLRPEAIQLVNEALEKGVRIAVATNPLFPATAIHQRLDWAGLSPAKIPFAHITTYETSHFAKPNPAYYAEILAYLGWPEDPVLMIGDDWELDIQPAHSLGLTGFWIHENGAEAKHPLPANTSTGSVASLLPWLAQTPLAAPVYQTSIATQATLRATPAVLSTQLADLPPERWHIRQSAEQWSLTEIVCHMRDVELRVNLPRIQQILLEENPFIAGVDTDAWVEANHYVNEDGPAAFQAFLATRLETLSLLDTLTESDWKRPARHAIFGPTSFQEIGQFMAEHDRLHIRQIHPFVSTK
ncbi:MAG TPA: HAD-IA family hydrolase [Anaerolineales bacterium]|nr:HAD-IA family hydrolase [Anaerolineales bacterium]